MKIRGLGSARQLSDLDRQGFLVGDIQVLIAQEHDAALGDFFIVSLLGF